MYDPLFLAIFGQRNILLAIEEVTFNFDLE